MVEVNDSARYPTQFTIIPLPTCRHWSFLLHKILCLPMPIAVNLFEKDMARVVYYKKCHSHLLSTTPH